MKKLQPKEWRMGQLVQGREYVVPQNHFMPVYRFESSERIANGTTKERYVPGEWFVRPGGEDHKQYRSRGLSC